MGTFLFDEIIFGPVLSRRLGVSLGINLLPVDYKICNFDCIYCECGLNKDLAGKKPKQDLPSRADVKQLLKDKIISMYENEGISPDVITFAGNGEPTLHPDFAGIIDDTIEIRNEHCPEAKIAVLSNATKLNKQDIFDSLLKIDQNILKLDSLSSEFYSTVNQPLGKYDISEVINKMETFKGKCIVQTMFVTGEYQGVSFDNTIETEVNNLIETYKKISPEQVMIYTISRDTPISSLSKVKAEKLDLIAKKIEFAGFKVQVSY